ncbi:MAG: L,D-transpeptidase [Flavobacteriales bacterium]|nr:L,D-transpeptidase [Flavobacteriales bacterium]
MKGKIHNLIVGIVFSFLPVLFFQCDSSSVDSTAHQIEIREPLSDILDSLSLTAEDVSVLIDKSDYSLKMMNDGLVLKSYPVVLGFNAIDDKRREGDGCTPEGKFKIVDKYPHAKWSKFIWINYPTPDSWDKFNTSVANGELANGATIGGEIGIHGVPSGGESLIENQTNWTAGCISLSTEDINEIYPFITKSTTITIQQ